MCHTCVHLLHFRLHAALPEICHLCRSRVEPVPHPTSLYDSAPHCVLCCHSDALAEALLGSAYLNTLEDLMHVLFDVDELLVGQGVCLLRV